MTFARRSGELAADGLITVNLTQNLRDDIVIINDLVMAPVLTLGATAVGDQGGALWFWHPTSEDVDDGINTVTPTGRLTAGRWKVLLSNRYETVGSVEVMLSEHISAETPHTTAGYVTFAEIPDVSPVIEVDGKTGAVNLSAVYDPLDAASTAISDHEAADDPHAIADYVKSDEVAALAPVQSVDSLTGEVDLSSIYVTPGAVPALAPVQSVDTFTGEVDLSGLYDALGSASEYLEDSHIYGFLSGTTIDFNDSTYTFTITPTGSDWWYYRAGIKYEVTGAKSVILPGSPPATDKYYFYLAGNDGAITASTVAWNLATDTVTLVAILEWNNSLTPKYLLYDERHPADISRGIHRYLHSTTGAKLASGADVSGYTLQGTLDTHNTIGITEAVLYDETLRHVVSALSDPNGSDLAYIIRYRSGSNWVWAESAVPYPYAVAGYIEYDNAGTLTEATGSNQFINSWLIVTPEGFHIIAGQALYTTLGDAQLEEFVDNTFTDLPIEEFVAINRLTWRAGTSYTQKGKARLEAIKRISVSGIPAAVGSTLPPQITAEEIADPSGVELRSYSPADIQALIDASLP